MAELRRVLCPVPRPSSRSTWGARCCTAASGGAVASTSTSGSSRSRRWYGPRPRAPARPPRPGSSAAPTPRRWPPAAPTCCCADRPERAGPSPAAGLARPRGPAGAGGPLVGSKGAARHGRGVVERILGGGGPAGRRHRRRAGGHGLRGPLVERRLRARPVPPLRPPPRGHRRPGRGQWHRQHLGDHARGDRRGRGRRRGQAPRTVPPRPRSQPRLLAEGYERPYAHTVAFLDALDAAEPTVPADRRVLAALGPRMLELAAERSAGAHPYFVPVEHTAMARRVMGEGPLLAPELTVVLEPDPTTARQLARTFTTGYLGLPNYADNLRRFAFDDDDLAGGGSDRLVDAVVAWGAVDAIGRVSASTVPRGPTTSAFRWWTVGAASRWRPTEPWRPPRPEVLTPRNRARDATGGWRAGSRVRTPSCAHSVRPCKARRAREAVAGRCS